MSHIYFDAYYLTNMKTLVSYLKIRLGLSFYDVFVKMTVKVSNLLKNWSYMLDYNNNDHDVICIIFSYIMYAHGCTAY